MDIRIREKLDILAEKLEAVLIEREGLKKDLQYFMAENRELRDKLSSMKDSAKNFPVRPESRIIAVESGRNAQKIAAISREIDAYVKEIDQCIAQLEN